MPIQKINFDELVGSMSVFLNFDEVEQEVRLSIEDQASHVSLREAISRIPDDYELVLDYISVSTARQFSSRIKNLLSISSASFELFQNVLLLLFDDTSLGQVVSSEQKVRTIARFMADPNSLGERIPHFAKERFLLHSGWREMYLDSDSLRRSLAGNPQILANYSVQYGLALERRICEGIGSLGLGFEKGSWSVLNDKEVDIAIPSLADPRVIVFCSYQLTSASGMTMKSNEQRQCYSSLSDYNRRRDRRNSDDVLFVNFVDGGGWLRRKNDLKDMHSNCDFCFNYKTRDDFYKLLSEQFV